MPDIMLISSILSSVKTAAEITKFLRESDLSIEKAEIKLKLADLVGALADAKMQLADVQELLQKKDQRIFELEEAFQTKDKLIRPQHLDAYYRIDDNGEPIGNPLCLACWENHQKQRQLVSLSSNPRIRVCTSCGHQYQNYGVPLIEPKKEES